MPGRSATGYLLLCCYFRVHVMHLVQGTAPRGSKVLSRLIHGYKLVPTAPDLSVVTLRHLITSQETRARNTSENNDA